MSRLCPPWESSEQGPRRPFLPATLPTSIGPPPQSLFFQDERIFQKLQPIVGHNRRRLSQFYAAFPVRGGSLSAGIEGRGDAAGTTRGCLSNALWLREKGMKGGKRKPTATHAAYKHTASTHAHTKTGCDLKY